MRKRKLGNSDLKLTVIGFGAWALGGGEWAFGWGDQDDEASIEAIHRALDLGVNWIDTAAVYGLGRSEEVVGRALHGKRDRVIIATKCGLRWDHKGRIKGFLSAESVREEVENSLRRLDVDVIDLYQIHWPTKPKQDLEGWETMARLKEEGKVRHIGVSNFSVRQLEAIQAIHPVASLQPPYSLLEREVERELLPYCAASGIGVVAYSPMQCGLLTGKMTRERVASLPENDFRKRDRHFQEPDLSTALQMVEDLKAVATDRSVAQLALAWVLRREEVTSAIVGTRHPRQIEETIKAADWKLTSEEIEAVEKLL
jgi:aryl-alcohol dehydrogenase-like predicted oxidoreductase